jgi:hypothetical protein
MKLRNAVHRSRLFRKPWRLLSQPPLDHCGDVRQLGRPRGLLPRHFSRPPRQQVAVACRAMNDTGGLLKGVCLPSFRRLAASNRFTRRSPASVRAASNLSCEVPQFLRAQPKRRRNGDLASSSKGWCAPFAVGLCQCSVTVDARIPSCRNSPKIMPVALPQRYVESFRGDLELR